MDQEIRKALIDIVKRLNHVHDTIDYTITFVRDLDKRVSALEEKNKMKDNYNLNEFVNGFYTIEIRDKTTKQKIEELKSKNIIVKTGATIQAKTVVGNNQYKIGYIYGEYAPAGTYPLIHGLTATKDDTIDTLRTSPRMTTNAEAPILYSSFNSDSGYTDNIVTCTATLNHPDLVDKQLVGIGFVAKFGTTELLYSHAYLAETRTLSSNHEAIIYWGLRFTV